jgi:hypothetical protein
MEVVSFINYTPPRRFDSLSWTDAQIEEAATEDGTWTVIDTISLGAPDADPSAPVARDFTTSLGTAPDLWYRVSFLDGASNTSEPTLPVQNVAAAAIASAPYATVDELALILRVDPVTREPALTRVLTAAAIEIDSELGRAVPFDDPPPALVVEVNLERAVEHWHQLPSPFGIVSNIGDIALHVSRDTWERHALKLQPLKETWGLA